MESQPLKILVIEDNPTDFFLLKEFIKLLDIPLNDVDNCTAISEALVALERKAYDLIFLDLTLPDSEGLNSFTQINAISSHIPIIVLTSVRNEELALEVVKHGAQDYLIKGNFEAPLLKRSIKYSIERKKNLDTLKQSETRYKYLFEHNPVPMWAFDVETLRFLFVNRAAIEHYGYSREEFLNMTIQDIRPASEQERLLQNLDIRTEGVRQKKEWIHLKKNGEIIIVDIVAHNIIVDDKKARLILAYDVTERNRAQQEVLFQANILKNIRDIVMVTDLEGVIKYWNMGATKIFGYSPEEAIGRHIGLIEKLQNPATYEKIITHIEKEKVHRTEIQALTKNNQSIWLNMKVSYMLNMAHEKQSLLWIANDVTEELRNKEKLLIQKSALEAVGVGLAITNPQEKGNPVVLINPKFESLTGYSAKEMIGNSYKILQGPDTDLAMSKRIEECIENQSPFEGEVLNYRKNGETFWNKLLINPIFDEKGKLINYVYFLQDVTEAKNDKEDLLYKNRELNTFIYKSSHDLRSPIATLLGLIKFAQNETCDEQILSYLKMMEESSERLDQILKTLMDMISFKQVEARYEEVNFGQVLHKVLHDLRERFDMNGLELKLNVDNGVILRTDLKMLEHILFQIVENAIKFRDRQKDKLLLEVSLRHSAQKHSIAIRDNGLGISKKYLDRIFDMFFRANENYPGSGLGLYIAKNLIEKLSGRLYIQTEPGKGTMVTIELPANNASQDTH